MRTSYPGQSRNGRLWVPRPPPTGCVLSSISGAYGYSLNKKAAVHLLKKTGKLYLPVDEFKRYIDTSYLRVGGIVPEVIAQGPGESTIEPPDYKGRINWALIKLLRMRNQLIAQFS